MHAFAVFDFKWTAEALANIVDNAIKYTEHGTITIFCRKRNVCKDRYIGYRFRHTETEQAKIFARFYRSNSVQKQEGVASAYTLPDRSYPARAVISRLFSSGKRKYVFHISAEITTILSKLLDFIFRRKECGKIPM